MVFPKIRAKYLEADTGDTRDKYLLGKSHRYIPNVPISYTVSTTCLQVVHDTSLDTHWTATY